MAEENTTDSTQTTPTPPGETPAADLSTSTTANPNPAPAQPPAEDDAAPGTILTDPGKEDAGESAGEDNGDEGENAEDDTAAFYGAPEGDYELSGLPEGTVIDTKALEAVSPVAKELNLSNEGFSRIAGVYAEQVLPGVVEGVTDGIQREIAARHAAWATEATEMVKTDGDFGGKPLKEIQQVSAKALDRFFSPEFRTYLDDTGLGNHPQMLKGMFTVGSLIAEDTTFERGSTAPAPKSRTEKYYGPAQT